MSSFSKLWALVALALLSPAWGQEVYRTGNSYSDKPGGDRVHLVDNVVQSEYSPRGLYSARVTFPDQRMAPPSPPPVVQVYQPPPRITIVLPPVYVLPQPRHHGHAWRPPR